MTFFGQDSKTKVFAWLAMAIALGAATGALGAYLIYDATH